MDLKTCIDEAGKGVNWSAIAWQNAMRALGSLARPY
jgi:hypothetical protein